MCLKNIYTLVLLVCGSLLFTNCASLTGFESGKTVGEGNGFFSASLNATRTPDFDLELSDSTDLSFFFPNIEIGGRYGIIDKLDMGMKANTNLNVMLDAKYQLLGDENSKAAMSIGLGGGTFGLVSSLWNIQIPAYFSFHPSEKVAFYVNPRYVVQFAAGNLDIGALNYFGGNAGLLLGEKVKFGLDAGFYNVRSTDDDSFEFDNLMTFGLGVQIPF